MSITDQCMICGGTLGYCRCVVMQKNFSFTDNSTNPIDFNKLQKTVKKLNFKVKKLFEALTTTELCEECRKKILNQIKDKF